MSEKPNVTVIYQEARAPGPTLGAVLLELIVFLAMAFLIGGGCSWLLW